MGALGVVSHVLASAVADDGTVAIAYPTGQSRTTLLGSTGGDLTVGDGAYGRWEQADPGFSVVFGASTITITNLSGMTWPAGETIRVSFGDTPRNGSFVPTIGNSEGQAKGSALKVLELVASGAVPAGIDVVELNHVSVVIAATHVVVPNTTIIVKDTSATGTEAHTFTVSGGTLNAAGNTIATFNLLGEEIMVHFDSAGRGCILANVGSVGVSGP